MAPRQRIVSADAATVPMRAVGPLLLAGPTLSGEFFVPLASYETPLFPSVERGARVCARAGGIRVTVADSGMARSILIEAADAASAVAAANWCLQHEEDFAKVVAGSSRFARLKALHTETVGPLLFLRITITTGDAAGHNMVTLAAQRILEHILQTRPDLGHVSVSGNFCTDKKVSAVNGLLGRGHRVVAECVVSRKLCRRYLHTTPEAIAELNRKKNLVGSILAGSLRSANAHYANMLLAFYLATGQDAANIVEGSQGITLADVRDDALVFSCNLPNIIAGPVGNGKDLPFVKENLQLLDCTTARPLGENARRLAALAAATVLCGELSLLAALTNPGELMQAHRSLERKESQP